MGSASLSLYGLPGRNSARMEFEASGFSSPDTEYDYEDETDSKGGVTHYKITTSYSSPKYDWTFSDEDSSSGLSGTHTFSGLSSGSRNWVGATVRVYCTKSVSKDKIGYDPPPEPEPKPEPKPEPEKPAAKSMRMASPRASETVSLGSASDDMYVWTKPSSFSFNLPDWGWTDSWLMKDTWNEFVEVGGLYLSWENQSDESMSGVSFPSDGHIGARLFNSAARLLGVSVRVSEGDRIKASLFEELASDL